MNAFCEHHEHSIRASYQCFDRILLNGLLQWTAANAKLSATVGVKNALDKQFIDAAYFTPGSGPISIIPDRGRQWYVMLKTSF